MIVAVLPTVRSKHGISVDSHDACREDKVGCISNYDSRKFAPQEVSQNGKLIASGSLPLPIKILPKL